jgi:RNA polymerase sigma factor (sigma-70 family)
LSAAPCERAWVRGAQAGSAADFSRLVVIHQAALRGFLRRLCTNHADADEIAQQSFVFAWEQISRFDPGRDFRPWLFGIAWRKYREEKRSWFRRFKREGSALPTENMYQPDPGLQLDIQKAIDSLPTEQRAAVLLCLVAEFTHGEAAQALALPLGTVKSHIARGREKLVSALGGIHG